MTFSDWGDLGSAVGGIATALLVLAGVVVGLPGVRDWRELQAQRSYADEQADQIRLDRRRMAYRWSPGAVSPFEAEAANNPEEIR
jgi:hypothetical protein